MDLTFFTNGWSVIALFIICWCVNGKSDLPIEWKLTKMLIKWEQNVFE